MDTVKEKLSKLISRTGFVSWCADAMADMLIQNGVTIATDTNVGDKWVSVDERLPIKEMEEYRAKYNGEDPEFIVMIKGASEPTCLTFNGRKWITEIGDPYTVTHWMSLPRTPKEVR